MKLARVMGGFCFVFFLLAWTLVCLNLIFPLSLPGSADWPEAVLLVLAVMATLFSLSQQLPAQNVLLASLIIALIGSAASVASVLTSMPFGPYTYTNNFGFRFFDTLPWPVPLIWVVAVLNSRGVARLILRPWRKTRTYGWWVIGFTAGLCVLLDAAWQPFATRVKEFWFWNPTKLPFDWYGTPITDFVGWAVTALFILAFATPVLINKKPSKHPPDYQPLVVWVLLNAVFAVGAGLHHLWLAVGLCAVSVVVVAVAAIRGARW